MAAEQRLNGSPDRIVSYFRQEKGTLTIVTISGLIYNVGMIAGPLFEGKMAQCLYDIISGTKVFSDMAVLAATYVGVILFVQAMRYIKRFYVRRFANNINRSMKHILYNSLVHKSKAELAQESVGSLMTKAISDVDACTEGMRKFTTEIFDTGVVMIAYLGLLIYYDWRLALLSCLFPPIAYVIAEKMRTVVTASAAAFKQSNAMLNDLTMDRVTNILTYRLFGQDGTRRQAYEAQLTDYEHKAVRAGIWETAMPPLYLVISMAGVLPIIWFGARNVMQQGWAAWDIAAFTTFLSCFTKLASKSSKAAKLFNAVQKAQVSWQRIKPLMVPPVVDQAIRPLDSCPLVATDVSFSYPQGPVVFSGLTLTAPIGSVVGVTGPVASGKSTLVRVFLNEFPYQGTITLGCRDIRDMTGLERSAAIAYLGHDPELLSDSVAANVLMGDAGDAAACLKAVCLYDEVMAMEQQMDTPVGSGGIRLSGGQQARLALARILAHPRPLVILDDPFSAVDRATELAIWDNLAAWRKDRIVILISHRLYLFSGFDQVIWLKDGRPTVATHDRLLATNSEYAHLYGMQTEGGERDA